MKTKIVSFLFAGAMMISPVVHAKTLDVTYGLYAGGFNVVDIQGRYDLADDRYDLTMDLETVGTLGMLVPWSGVITSEGHDKGTTSTPLKHSFASTWRGEIETNEFTFDDYGTLISYNRIEEDGSVTDKMPKKDILDGNPVDMLSALFRVMNGQSCAGSIPAMDGKRSFNMVFRSKGTQLLEPSKYNVYSGDAEICDVEIVPLKGKWHDKPRGWMSIQEQAKDNDQLPKLWFGKVSDDMPAIPVKFFIKTNYGAMIMHLKSINNE